MRVGIFSDVHANLLALEAVLDDTTKQGIAELISLGDVVGYGPNPRECLEIVCERTEQMLLGNHDLADVDPDSNTGGFNREARQSAHWHHDQLAAGNYLELLARLEPLVALGDITLCHGTPRNPLNEYVFPDDVWNTKKMQAVFGASSRIVCVGHAHVPGIYFIDGNRVGSKEIPGFPFEYDLSQHEKVLVNVGSVGQPRDFNPQACYVVLDDHSVTVTFRRVPYDCEAVKAAIHAIPQLSQFLGNRLVEGR